jgi:hypothetical protein
MSQRIAKSYPSDHAPSGYTARQVALSMAELGVQLAEYAALIAEDQTDGDVSNTATLRSTAQIAELSTFMTHIQWLVADGNLAEARRMLKEYMTSRQKKASK